MEVLRSVVAARERRFRDLVSSRRTALVPTMGFLHDGHLSLVRRARKLAELVWVSIFVNPTQFAPGEDLDRYPRNLERDLRLLEADSVDVVFAPSDDDIYPCPPALEMGFSGLERRLCGVHRPGHFAGVGLVVAKLFNIIQPDVAVFGQKDAQQALLMGRLVQDLSFPIEVVVAPTVREADGLAMSSRNAYLTDEQRRAAPAVHRTLLLAEAAILEGETEADRICRMLRREIEHEPLLELEYAECVDQFDLSVPSRIVRPVLLAIAVQAGSTRLIDNLPVTPPAGGGR